MIFTLAKIAWRNIWRNPSRSILTILAVAFATGVLVFFISLQLSSYATSINATVSIFQGHLQVQRKGFLEKHKTRLSILQPDKIREKLSEHSEIEVFTERGSAFALVSSEKRSYGIQVIGVEPEAESRISTLSGTLRQGTYFSTENSYEAVLGTLLAKNLQVEVGDELSLLGQGWDGSMAAGIVKVIGVFETGSNEIDRSMLQIPLEPFAEIFSLSGVHAFVARVRDLDNVDVVAKSLQAEFEDDIAVHTWEALVPGLKDAIQLDMAAGWLFFLSLILIVTFTVLNTFLMAVLERVKEFCIMLALGCSPSKISLMVVLECAFLTLCGIGFGLLLGGLVVTYFGVVGFSVPGSEEVVKEWNVPAVVFTKLSVASLTRGPVILFLAALFSLIIPLVRIHRLRPTEAIGAK